jgi:prepilin-type processing-associated H-X9-DG protein
VNAAQVHKGSVSGTSAPAHVERVQPSQVLKVRVMEGRAAPNFSLQDLDGAAVSLASLRGTPAVLNFWSTWCQPCKIEHADLQQAARDYLPRGVRFLGILYNDEPRAAKAMLAKQGGAFPTLLDPGQRTAIGLTGYGYNYNYLSPSDYPAPDYVETPRAVSYANIATVAETVTFATSARMSYASPHVVEGNTYLEPPSSEYPTFQGRHSGAGIVGWADGHVKGLKPTYRSGPFGYGGAYNANEFTPVSLGDIDRDGDLTTDELFDLE